MKTIITTLNSKYIHKALSLRLLYVACKDDHDVDFIEFTIKDHENKIIDELLETGCDNIAFSVYIWNVEKTMAIIEAIKQKKPEIKIIVGGPEVSYDVDYFIDNFPIDYLISGEGELALNQLLSGLKDNTAPIIQGISSQTAKDYRQTVAVALEYLETLESPYLLERDLPDMKNRILYFETSRGCPYKCQYCLSSLEVGLRFFSLDYLFSQLEGLLKTDVKTIKLLDRSFNAKYEHAMAILEFIVAHQKDGVVYQFEINGDVLDQRLLDYLCNDVPEGLIRLEIGIQSTYEPTNRVVQRFQNFERLKEVIIALQQSHNIVLHLDLIAGLPKEGLERFKKSFNDVFSLHPKELQLGFLKLLRGTKLRKDYEEYGYQFDQDAPYEIISSTDLTKDDVAKIHLAEEMLEKYWNSGRFDKTMARIYQREESMFDFFLELGEYYRDQGFKRIGYQLDELYSYLWSFLQIKNAGLFKWLLIDYFTNSKIKPKRFYEATISTPEAKAVLHRLVEKGYDQDLLFRYSIVERVANEYIIGIFKDYRVQLICIDRSEIDE